MLNKFHFILIKPYKCFWIIRANLLAINNRIAKAGYELSFAQQFDKIIVNDNLEKAVLETYNSVKGFLDGGNGEIIQ